MTNNNNNNYYYLIMFSSFILIPGHFQQELYRTSEAPLKLSYLYYNLTMVACIAYKLITTLDNCLQNIGDKDRPEDRQGAVCKLLQPPGHLHW